MAIDNVGTGNNYIKFVSQNGPFWDDLRTAIESEKKLRTAGDEIYKLVTSNDEFRDRNIVKLRIGVWVCGLKLTKS